MYDKKGSLVQRELSPQATEGLLNIENKAKRAKRGNQITIPPTFSCENATSLYTREAWDLVPLERGFVTNAWLTGQSLAHLCVASNVRAMPENEIPPVLRGDIYWFNFNLR